MLTKRTKLVLAAVAVLSVATAAFATELWVGMDQQVQNGYTPGTGMIVYCDPICAGNPYDAECDGDCFSAIHDHSPAGGGGGRPIIWI